VGPIAESTFKVRHQFTYPKKVKKKRRRRLEKFPRPVKFWDTCLTILKIMYRFTAPTSEAYRFAQYRQMDFMPVINASRGTSAGTVTGYNLDSRTSIPGTERHMSLLHNAETDTMTHLGPLLHTYRQ